MGITYIMRCIPREALHSALMGLGESGKLKWAFVERLKGDRATKRGGPDSPHVVNHAASTPVAASLGMVAWVLSLRASARVITSGAGAADRKGWAASAPTLSAAHASDGSRTDSQALDGTRTTDGAAPTSTNRRWVKVGKPG